MSGKKKKETPSVKFVAYTDGSALQGRGNSSGNGGYGAYISKGKEIITLTKGYFNTTNNRMEIMGMIATLEAIGPDATVEIHTDSTYVLLGATRWVNQWARNNWYTFSGTPVKNADLWMRVKHLLNINKVKLFKVKAHSGVEGNELADALARQGTDNPTETDVGFEESR